MTVGIICTVAGRIVCRDSQICEIAGRDFFPIGATGHCAIRSDIIAGSALRASYRAFD